MGSLRRSVGFIAALGNTKIKSILWPEGTLAILFGLVGSSLAIEYIDLHLRVEAASDALRVLSSLLGMVLAGLMLVITISNDEYMRLLGRSSVGVVGFYQPFILAIGLQVLTILLLIAYRAIARDLGGLEEWFFRVIAVLFIFALLDIVALARSLLMHAVTRAMQSDIPKDDATEDQMKSSELSVPRPKRPWRS